MPRQLALGGEGRCRSLWMADCCLGVGGSALNVWGFLPCVGVSLVRLWKGSHTTHTHPPCPGGLGCSGTLGTWPWRMLGAGGQGKAWLGLMQGWLWAWACRGTCGRGKRRMISRLGPAFWSPQPHTAPEHPLPCQHQQTALQERREITKTKAFQAISGAASMRCPRLRHGAHISLLS